MKRSAVCLFVSIAIGGLGSTAHAAGKDAGDKTKSADAPEGDTGGAAPAAGGDADTAAGAGDSSELDLSDKTDKATTDQAAAAVKTNSTALWQDIVVVPRKRFLKGGRVELAPFTGVSLNDILIRHYSFGADINYFLTDALWVGLQGIYYVNSLTDRESLVGLQYNRIPTLNKYLYGGSLNFGYVPIYGKFALFNKNILHWEIYASAGVGVTQTEIIPRNVDDAAFQNTSITPNFGLGGRFFLLDWLTVDYAVRDYVILDKFENTSRPAGQSAADAKANADSALVHNVMFYAGVGFYLPTSFQYKTPR
jgi:outer membrane beta-barrel protein